MNGSTFLLPHSTLLPSPGPKPGPLLLIPQHSATLWFLHLNESLWAV